MGAIRTSGSKTWKEGWANRSIETRAVTTGLKTWKELSLQVKCNLELRDGVEELRGKLRKTDIESGGQLARMNSKLRDAQIDSGIQIARHLKMHEHAGQLIQYYEEQIRFQTMY